MALAVWILAALAYGVFLAELSEVDTREVCEVRQQVFVPEAWEQGERDSGWWQFSSACNDEYDLVPDWWALAVVVPVALSALVLRTLLRGGAAPHAVARCDA